MLSPHNNPSLLLCHFPPALKLEQTAQFDNTFLPTWVTEANNLTLQCTFTSALLPFQQDVSWFKDGKYG